MGGDCVVMVGSKDRHRRRRGQTTTDFTFGVSLFLITLAVTFSFISIPIGADVIEQDHTAASDRIATHLTTTALTDGDGPRGALDTACSVAFFNNSTPNNCQFTTTDIHNLTGIDDDKDVYITITAGGDVQAIDGVVLSHGSPPPTTAQDIAIRSRVVTIGGEPGQLQVKVWDA